jgi:hypothetical protein
MKAFMKDYYSPGKTQRLHNKIATFAQYPTETISEAFERFNKYTRAVPHHKFLKEDLVQKFYQGITMASRTIIDASAGGSIIEITPTEAFTLFKKVAVMTHGRHTDAYFRFNPRGTSKESCKWRRKTFLKARSIHSCGGWRKWR